MQRKALKVGIATFAIIKNEPSLSATRVSETGPNFLIAFLPSYSGGSYNCKSSKVSPYRCTNIEFA
jgi:acetoacetate decarboxylase